MSRENKELSLEALEQSKAHLDVFIPQRLSLIDQIGTGRVKPDSIDNAVRVGRIKKKLATQTQRLEVERASIMQSIETLQTNLIPDAVRYTEQVKSKLVQLQQIRDFTREGLLDAAILANSEKEFQELKARPGSDPNLKRGLELLKESKNKPVDVAKPVEPIPPAPSAPTTPKTPDVPAAPSPTKPELEVDPEMENWPKMQVNTKTGAIMLVEGRKRRTIKMRPYTINLQLLKFFAVQAGKSVVRTELQAELQRLNSSLVDNPSISVRNLKDVLEKDPNNPTILVSESMPGSRVVQYRLKAQVKLDGQVINPLPSVKEAAVKPAPTPDAPTTPEAAIAAPQINRIEACALVMQCLTSYQGVLELNKLKCPDEELTRYLNAMIRPEVAQYWANLPKEERQTMLENYRHDALATLVEAINDDEKMQLFNGEEKAVWLVLDYLVDIQKANGVEVLQDLIDRNYSSNQITDQQMFVIGIEWVKKTRANTEPAHKGPITRVINMDLLFAAQRPKPEVVEAPVETAPEPEPELEPEAIPAEVAAPDPEPPAPAEETEDTHASTEHVQVTKGVGDLLKTSAKSETLQILRRDPKIHEHLAELLDQTGGAHLSFPVPPYAISNAFPRLTIKTIRDARQRGYVNPDLGRNGNAAFTQRELITIAYMHDFGNGLSPKMRKELLVLIEKLPLPVKSD